MKHDGEGGGWGEGGEGIPIQIFHSPYWNDNKSNAWDPCTYESDASICIYSDTFQSIGQHARIYIVGHRPIGKHPHYWDDTGHESQWSVSLNVEFHDTNEMLKTIIHINWIE